MSLYLTPRRVIQFKKEPALLSWAVGKTKSVFAELEMTGSKRIN